MGMFKDAAIRLLREDKWPSIEVAMEEVFAVLQTETPMTFDGPITINNPTDGPGVIVNQLVSNDPPYVVRRGTNPDSYQVPVLLPPDATGGEAPATTAGATVRQVLIAEIKGDTLKVNDARDTTFRGVVVAKPPQLRQNTPVPVGVTSYAYTGTDGQNRTSTFKAGDGETILTELQTVVPPYTVGDTVYVIEVLDGVVDAASTDLSAAAKVAHIDMNVDARGWATIIPADEPG